MTEQRRIRALRRFADARKGEVVRLEVFDGETQAAIVGTVNDNGIGWVNAHDLLGGGFILWADVDGLADGPLP